MTKALRPTLSLAAALLVAGCQTGPVPEAPRQADLTAELTDRAPTARTDGTCWASDTTPAVIETTTEIARVTAAAAGAPADPAAPGTYRSEVEQRIVAPGRTVWFRAPCPDELTPAAIATLQRALQARGLYAAPPSGRMDAATDAAVRRFQAARGLDSAKLALASARELGVVAEDFGLPAMPAEPEPEAANTETPAADPAAAGDGQTP